MSVVNLHQNGPSRGVYAREIRIARIALAFTLLAWVAVSWEMGEILGRRLAADDLAGAGEQLLFVLIVEGLLCGNFVYQFTRLGYLHRRYAWFPKPAAAREAVFAGEAPRLAILVPSYKEELAVVRRTLLSAALQDYPERRVVLLIDDAPDSPDAADQRALAAARRLPLQLQVLFDAAAAPFIEARREFLARRLRGQIDRVGETVRIGRLYERAAQQVAALAAGEPLRDHADRLLHDQVFARAIRAHRERGVKLGLGSALDAAGIEREYRRLAELFRVELSSFERKAYVNLSHAPNKAMNLNSYIGLLGRRWQEVERADGRHLERAADRFAAFAPPAADFLLTLDADSLLVPEYAATLVAEMRRPGNERLAVAQTPYNAIPGAPGLLERLAGATTDIQYLIHQGFTRHGATYWVGANALLRMAALADIRQPVVERGFTLPVFIQDRTVIEDTESSVDLVARGWWLYNHPERLAFSATPPDFGALLIQRRRWANGGLIILPKLLRYLAAAPLTRARVAEGFFRVHYLASIAAVNFGLLILFGYSFANSTESPWLPLTAVPYFALYARDLRYSGYRASDVVRIYALNLLLLVVNLGGVLKSLQQAITGARIPFCRTPKVRGRTVVPAGYLLAEFALLGLCVAVAWADLMAGRWASLAFHAANGALLYYALRTFIGLGAAWADMRHALAGLAHVWQVEAGAGDAPAAAPVVPAPAVANPELPVSPIPAPVWILPVGKGRRAPPLRVPHP